MTQNSSHILHGPEDISDIPKESMGKYFFECLKKRNAENVVYVDAVTGAVLTNGKLLQDSIKAAVIWKELGLEKGDVISTLTKNNISFCVPLLSALYRGIAMNLLNPGYTKEELRHSLLISKPKLIICSADNVRLILEVKQKLDFIKTVLVMGSKPEGYAEIQSLGELLENVQVNLEEFVPEPVDFCEQVAVILLSSGTTGLPKGVLLTHQNLRAALTYLTHPAYGNHCIQHVELQIVPSFHLIGLVIQLAGCATGMKTVLMEKFIPRTFLESIEKHKVTKLDLVPPLVLFLSRSPLADEYDLTSIKDILCGGAPLSVRLRDELSSRLPTAILRQAYGLTETGVCTYQPEDVDKPGSVGTLVPGIAAKVWNADINKSLGPSEIGELCFKGPMIMKGYIGSVSGVDYCIDEDGFYHTGDVGYYDEDQHFYIVDRMKELIKYKAFQVSPAELEALIITHPAVVDCGVVGIPDERAGQLPLAFVVRKKDEVVTEKDVINYVADRASVEKHLHGGVIFIDEVPKSASGKILRRKLLELYDPAQ